MNLRWAATFVIATLLVLDVVLPHTSIGRRGNEDRARTDVPSISKLRGERLPDFELETISGDPWRSEDLRGHRVLLTFERSVDW